MKIIGCAVGLLLLTGANAFGECTDGQTIEVSGTVARMYANQSGGWSIIAGDLDDDNFQGCNDFMELGGTKSASGAWVLLAVKDRPPSYCKAGSSVKATMRAETDLFVTSAKVLNWSCE